jgi:hypothetical protein
VCHCILQVAQLIVSWVLGLVIVLDGLLGLGGIGLDVQ